VLVAKRRDRRGSRKGSILSGRRAVRTPTDEHQQVLPVQPVENPNRKQEAACGDSPIVSAGNLRRWGTVRLRMTLWNVAVLALILGALGGVVRYRVQADRFAAVDRTLAERANEAGHQYVFLRSNTFRETRTTLRFRKVFPMAGAAERSPRAPRGLPPLPPRFIPHDPADTPRGVPPEEPWDRRSFARSLAGLTVFSTVRDHGVPMRVVSTPIESGGKVDRVLQLAYPLGDVLREIDALTSTLLALVPLGLLAAGLGGAFLTGRALRPVREIAGTAARLGVNDLSERLPVSGHDEFSELAVSINAMLARLEEAFDRQRRFTADASHELRTPLSIVKANTSMALEHPWPEERYRDFLAAIDTAAGRQSRIVEELLFLARADAGQLARDVGPVCLIEVLEEAAENCGLRIADCGLGTNTGSAAEESLSLSANPQSAIRNPQWEDRPCIRLEAIDPALMVAGSGSELTRLFTNLLENAVRHTPPEGRVTVSARVEARSVTVTVTDTGEGIAPEHLPHLGERFYRVDAARSAGTGGTGLGLAICRSITAAHGGRMSIESQLGAGTTVRIRLLLCPPVKQA
jgi:signal transduction histidine kinase